jgi:hypothetical protein
MHERTETHGARTSRFLRKNLKLWCFCFYVLHLALGQKY